MRGRQKTYEAVLISHVCRLGPYHLITIREDGLIVYVRRVGSIWVVAMSAETDVTRSLRHDSRRQVTYDTDSQSNDGRRESGDDVIVWHIPRYPTWAWHGGPTEDKVEGRFGEVYGVTAVLILDGKVPEKVIVVVLFRLLEDVVYGKASFVLPKNRRAVWPLV